MNRWCVFFSCAVLLASWPALVPPSRQQCPLRRRTFFATPPTLRLLFGGRKACAHYLRRHWRLTPSASRSRGGEPAPLTNSKTNAAFGVGYFPNDDRISTPKIRAATS